MPVTIRKIAPAVAFAMPVGLRALLVGVTDHLSTVAHYDVTSTPVSPAPDHGSPVADVALAVSPTGSQATLALVIAQAEATRTVLLKHFADALAHKVADATNAASISYTTIPLISSTGTQAQVNALNIANAAAVTAHESQAGVHSHTDSTNVTTAVASTSLSTSQAQATDTVTQVNAHILNALCAATVNVVPA